MKTYEQAKAEMKPEEIVLNELMREYSTTVFKLEEACQSVNTQIRQLEMLRDNLKQPYVDVLVDLESQMRLPMLDRQSTFICSFGKINFRKGATRRSYNLDALDALANHDAYIKDKIWAFRTESVGEPSITVKLAEVEG